MEIGSALNNAHVRGQKREYDPLNLELQMFVRYHVGAENGTWVHFYQYRAPIWCRPLQALCMLPQSLVL